MPELPEVETVVRELRPYLQRRAIVDVHVDWARTIAQPAEDIDQFCAGVRGRQIVDLRRRGKFILLQLGDGCRYRTSDGSQHRTPGACLIHLRMSGRLLVEPLGLPRHLRIVFDLSDGGCLYFYDQRKFGRVWLVHDPDTVVGDLGPEPLDEAFGPSALRALLRNRRGMLKPLLLNQRFIAGLGNIYVDESLFMAGLHPKRAADTLTEAEVRRLCNAIQTVLRQAIDLQGTTFDGVFVRPEGEQGRRQEGLSVYGQAGLPCGRCSTPIERIKVGGRGTHFCSRCQPLI